MVKDEKKDGVKKGLFSKKERKDTKKTPAKKAPAKKDEAKGGRKGPIRYVKDVWQELKKVTWPTKKELLTATLAVICFVVVFTLIIWLMDLAVTPAFQWLVG